MDILTNITTGASVNITKPSELIHTIERLRKEYDQVQRRYPKLLFIKNFGERDAIYSDYSWQAGNFVPRVADKPKAVPLSELSELLTSIYEAQDGYLKPKHILRHAVQTLEKMLRDNK